MEAIAEGRATADFLADVVAAIDALAKSEELAPGRYFGFNAFVLQCVFCARIAQRVFKECHVRLLRVALKVLENSPHRLGCNRE